MGKAEGKIPELHRVGVVVGDGVKTHGSRGMFLAEGGPEVRGSRKGGGKLAGAPLARIRGGGGAGF